MKPVVRWAGGKTRLLPELLARMPARYGTYYEPFTGGAALFFRLAPERAVLGDLNADLMVMYRAVSTDVESVIALLEQYAVAHATVSRPTASERRAAYYYEVRTLWNDHRVRWTAAERAAAFIYLNKTCFNGLWRVNRDGQFNVPAGKCKNPPLICDPVALRAAAVVLKNAQLYTGHYSAIVATAQPGDFVYFDPPYDETFTDYTGDGFGPNDQVALADCVRELVARGVQVMLSNSDTPRVRALYGGLDLDIVKCGRAINSDGAGRKPVTEVIVTGGYARRKIDIAMQVPAVLEG